MAHLDFVNDPKDHPRTLHVHQEQPFNAEAGDLAELIKYNITPTNLVFTRNHGPIPDIQEDAYRLRVDGLVENPLTLSLSDLKQMPRTDVVVALQVFPTTSIRTNSVCR